MRQCRLFQRYNSFGVTSIDAVSRAHHSRWAASAGLCPFSRSTACCEARRSGCCSRASRIESALFVVITRQSPQAQRDFYDTYAKICPGGVSCLGQTLLRFSPHLTATSPCCFLEIALSCSSSTVASLWFAAGSSKTFTRQSHGQPSKRFPFGLPFVRLAGKTATICHRLEAKHQQQDAQALSLEKPKYFYCTKTLSMRSEKRYSNYFFHGTENDGSMPKRAPKPHRLLLRRKKEKNVYPNPRPRRRPHWLM